MYGDMLFFLISLVQHCCRVDKTDVDRHQKILFVLPSRAWLMGKGSKVWESLFIWRRFRQRSECWVHCQCLKIFSVPFPWNSTFHFRRSWSCFWAAEEFRVRETTGCLGCHKYFIRTFLFQGEKYPCDGNCHEILVNSWGRAVLKYCWHKVNIRKKIKRLFFPSSASAGIRIIFGSKKR